MVRMLGPSVEKLCAQCDAGRQEVGTWKEKALTKACFTSDQHLPVWDIAPLRSTASILLSAHVWLPCRYWTLI